LPRLKDKIIREKVIKDMQKNIPYDFSQIIVNGKQVNNARDIVDILLAQNGRGFAFIDALNKQNLEKSLQHKLSFIASDGFAAPSDGPAHPRCFGAFPRFLGRYVRNMSLLDWEDAIYKITYGPAKKIGLEKRGILEKGAFADIVVFDPKHIIDKSTLDNPYQKPEGIKYVIVNGKIVVKNGEAVGKMAGTIIKN